MNYSFAGTPTSQSFERFADDLAAALDRRGYDRVDDATEADLVLNFIDSNEPKPVSPQVARARSPPRSTSSPRFRRTS